MNVLLLAVQIFSYLDVAAIGCCGQVCRGWAGAAQDIFLWKEKFAEDFGLSYSSCRLPKATKSSE